MSDQHSVTLGNQAGTSFHAMARAPKSSTPRITIAYDGQVAMLALDFGVGEPGKERKVLEVNRLGDHRFPEVIPAGVLLSYRARAIPKGETKIVVTWDDPQ